MIDRNDNVNKQKKIKKIQIMINLDDMTKINTKVDNPIWPRTPDQAYRILIIVGSWLVKTSDLINLINL